MDTNNWPRLCACSWRCLQGIVDVPLAAAAALDPTSAAARPSDSGCEAARAARRQAYRHVLEALRQLSVASGGGGSAGSGGNPGAAAALVAGVPPEQAAAPLPAAEREAARSALLGAALEAGSGASGDRFFLGCLFDAMVGMGQASELLAVVLGDAGLLAALQSHLANAAGLEQGTLAAAVSEAAEVPPVPPMNARQARTVLLDCCHESLPYTLT
jgi:hypothetical protein